MNLLCLFVAARLQAEERAKQKRRGNPDTHTTDERFDESFQLAYGLTGPKPWYARPVNPTAEDTARQIPRHQQQMLLLQQQQQEVQPLPGVRSVSGQLEDRRNRKRRRRDVSRDSSSSDSSSSSSSDSDSSRERSRRRRHGSSGSGRHKGDRSSRKHSSKHKVRDESDFCHGSGLNVNGLQAMHTASPATRHRTSSATW